MVKSKKKKKNWEAHLRKTYTHPQADVPMGHFGVLNRPHPPEVQKDNLPIKTTSGGRFRSQSKC